MLRIVRAGSYWLLFTMFVLSSAWAVTPGSLISQYAHTTWKIGDGVFFGTPTTVAQTTDGYLWIGTNLGLVRFDGVRFVQWNPPAGQRLLDSRIFSLLGSRDGSLWIGTGYSVSRWKDGQLTNYPELSGRIEALLEDDAGTIWLARTQITDGMGPVCRIEPGRLRCFGVSDGVPFPNVLQLAKNGDGDLWLSGYSELCRWKPGESTIYFPNRTGRQEGFALFNAIATGPDGSTWVVVDRSSPTLRLEHFTYGRWTSQLFRTIPAKNSEISTIFVDRDNQMWIGTNGHGVFRVQGDRVDHFDRTDGLSSNTVEGFYQDKEGTLWVVTSSGIDNFRDLHVVSYSMREGLTADGAVSVLASHNGGLWVIDDYDTAERLEKGKFAVFLPRPDLPGRHVTTMFEDHAGRLWFGLDHDLCVYDNGVFRTIRSADGKPLGIVFSITEDTRHKIWVRAGPNLDEIDQLTARQELTAPPISTSYILTATPDGGIVIGFVDGDLLKYRDGQMQSIASNEVGNTRQIRDLLVDPDGTVWGTTLDELFSLRGSTRENLTVRNGLPCDGLFALVEDETDAIWLYSQCGLIRIARSELNRWWQNPHTVVHTQLYDEGDGVQPGLTSLKPQATRTSDGHLWFANGHLLQEIDPEHPGKNIVPPPVHVESVIADRETYSPQEGLHLPPLTRDLEIQYTALSFVAPQKVRFRYRLEGRDVAWQEPGSRRQAFYSDLKPGRYRFRVIACNNDGIWNDEGALLAFSIAPAWYQTMWFQLLCTLVGVFVVWTLYRVRLRQIAAAMNARFDERMNERTRLAREFHDTLLQTIQGSKMVADDALDAPADPEHMHHALEKLSAWMGEAAEEGRAALNSLRTSVTQRNDLAEAFERAMESGLIPASMSVSLSVIGTPGDMHPIVRDEVYRIGYEAIRNASLHSLASQLEVELSYGQDLTFRVKDNGIGIDPAVIAAGKDGHFGLQGMRERVARIGGKLSLVSSANSGTELRLVVPGSIIFRKTRTVRGTLLTKIRDLFWQSDAPSKFE